MHRLNKSDWIALRLLYVLLASDPSAVRLPDVAKTLDHYNAKLRKRGESKYLGGRLQPVFALLNKEIALDGQTFGAPDVQLTRNVAVRWRRDDPAGDGVVQIDNGQWRTYGTNT